MSDDEEPTAAPTSIPLEWKDGPDGPVVSTERLVRKPTERDQQLYGHFERTCAECKHFSLKHGQNEMARTDFLRELVLEHKWKMGHLGDRPDNMGLCTVRDGTLTSPFAKQCDHFTEVNRRDRSAR